jgi:site-specific recombinase XerD
MASVQAEPGHVTTELDVLVDEARNYAAQAQATNTTKGYASDWTCFVRWCMSMNMVALPADAATVAMYITNQARSRKSATIRRHLVTISQAHKARGLE